MKNLEKEELKNSLKEKITSALKQIKNPEAVITIRFTEDKEVIGIEKIEYWAGAIYFKKVNLESLGKEKAIDLIAQNLSYDFFNYIDTKVKIGKIECHGFGDYWGTDKITIHYNRS